MSIKFMPAFVSQIFILTVACWHNFNPLTSNILAGTGRFNALSPKIFDVGGFNKTDKCNRGLIKFRRVSCFKELFKLLLAKRRLPKNVNIIRHVRMCTSKHLSF